MKDWGRLRNEVRIFAVRSRGPGGQNVNKVSSAALLVWNLGQSDLLSHEEKTRVQTRLANQINRDGELLVRSDEFRDLGRNQDRCMEKLIEWLERALHVPKVRKATRPTRASKVRRLESKRKRGEIKQSRRMR